MKESWIAYPTKTCKKYEDENGEGEVYILLRSFRRIRDNQQTDKGILTRSFVGFLTRKK